MLVDFFVRQPNLNQAASDALRWQIVLAAFATALGAANLLRIHGVRVSRRGNRWPMSVILLISMFIYTAIGVYQGPRGRELLFLFDHILAPLGATMFSLNAFFIASAAARAFRIRSLHSIILMVASFAVMFGNTGVGVALWSGFPAAGSWFMRILNVAGMRGIIIGAALGAMGISLRVILGLERGHLSGVE